MAEKPPGPHPPIVRWVLAPSLLTIAGTLAGLFLDLTMLSGAAGELSAVGAGFGLGAGMAAALAPGFPLRFLLAPVLGTLGVASGLGVRDSWLREQWFPDGLAPLSQFIEHHLWLLVFLPSLALTVAQSWIEAAGGRLRGSAFAVLGSSGLCAAMGTLAAVLTKRESGVLTAFFAALGAAEALGMWAALKLSAALTRRA